MRVFVTGATGVLGRPAVRRLVAAGHHVTALARSERSEERIRHLGAAPVHGDLFDADSLLAALAKSGAVLHLATHIPSGKAAAKAAAWSENDRIRAEGTRNLVDAALKETVRVLVYPSVCFGYADGGETWIDATSATVDPPAMLLSTITAEDAVHRFTEAGRCGVVLRMGYFYGPEAGNTREALTAARRGAAMVIGAQSAYLPQVWVDDAAAAVVAALDAPAGVFDVVDDEPLTRGELRSVMAHAVGRKRLLAPPAWLVRFASAGRLEFAARSQRVSNQRFRDATGWSPAVPSARIGWATLGETLV